MRQSCGYRAFERERKQSHQRRTVTRICLSTMQYCAIERHSEKNISLRVHRHAARHRPLRTMLSCSPVVGGRTKCTAMPYAGAAKRHRRSYEHLRCGCSVLKAQVTDVLRPSVAGTAAPAPTPPGSLRARAPSLRASCAPPRAHPRSAAIHRTSQHHDGQYQQSEERHRV